MIPKAALPSPAGGGCDAKKLAEPCVASRGQLRCPCSAPLRDYTLTSRPGWKETSFCRCLISLRNSLLLDTLLKHRTQRRVRCFYGQEQPLQ